MKRFIGILIFICFYLACSVQAIEQSLLLKLLELKRESYLARRGEVILDLVSSYSQDHTVIPWKVINSSSYDLSATVRLGISNRLEAYLRLPFSSLFKEEFVTDWQRYRAVGMRDPTLGFEYELSQEKFNRPATYLTIGARLPLAKSSYDNLAEDELELGSGHYATNWGLSFLKSIDPCVIYWGLEYLWTFKKEKFDPADLINYYGGLGWSLNQQVSLNLGISGTVVGEDKRIISGVEQVESSAYNLTGMSIGSTFVINPNFCISPTLVLGITDEENDFLFSLGLSFEK